MNKKFLIGLSAAAVATSFVACGEGQINGITNDDLAVQITYLDSEDSALYSLRDNAIKSCSGDPACAAKMGSTTLGGGNKTETPTSSAANDPIQPNPTGTLSSSSFMPTLTSSSSIVFNPAESSSSEENVPTGEYKLGTCAAVTNPIEKGKSTKWKFTLNNDNTLGWDGATAFSADFAWNYGTAGVAAGNASGFTSAEVTYAASGSVTASVTISKGELVKETITCAPLQVNGDPITGCKCEPAADAIDYTSEPNVTWSVTGCTSASMPLTYTWEGAAGEATYTKTFDAATAAYSPKLKVGNSDNTLIDVTCGAVKVTEGAEYTIKDNTDAGKVTLPGPGKYNVVIGFACQNKTFFCNGVGGPVGGSVDGVAMASSWYTTASLSAEACSGSATVVVEVDQAATCGAQ